MGLCVLFWEERGEPVALGVQVVLQTALSHVGHDRASPHPPQVQGSVLCGFSSRTLMSVSLAEVVNPRLQASTRAALL